MIETYFVNRIIPTLNQRKGDAKIMTLIIGQKKAERDLIGRKGDMKTE